ncbi:Riboflavin synthase [Marinobacterium sp. xm-a-121]|uniref:riboflavin synthase n=1 Tax=unclassified Marinobacterium TaxID=2644139 RepID=UPI001568CD21|nr:Riboflavin synthase [Marinobacterium sp. xm-a-121]NRQ00372.1 Riboflavin synthase [Marinobacterium sp. xm-v-233]
MFTGIIEAIGTVAAKQEVGGDLRLTLATGQLDMSDVALGDSIATNGVCLTVIEYDQQHFTADVSQESLAHTRLMDLQPGEAVNLEKALLPTTRLGGHLVSGHVDAVGSIVSIERDARSVRIAVDMPSSLARYIAPKGSVTIDGVSLTVNSVDAHSFHLNIVPHTADTTIISQYEVGHVVHIEVDMIARYLERLLQTKQESESSSEGISLEMLASAGFMHRR